MCRRCLQLVSLSYQRPQPLKFLFVFDQCRNLGSQFVPHRFGDGIPHSFVQLPSRVIGQVRQINDEVGPIVLVDGQEWEGEKGWTHFHP